MTLELKESTSPFWLIGIGKNTTFAGSSTNVPCFYKSLSKQQTIAKQILKNNKNVMNVYLLTGVQWDNMPSGGKEEFGYIKNKGKFILSRPSQSKSNFLELNDTEMVEEGVDPKLIVQGIMLAVDNWDELIKAITKLKELSQPIYDKAMTILQYLKDKGTDIKVAASEIANIVTATENYKNNKSKSLKESKIVEPIGNPQTAGSFVNIDIDLDHLEISDFIIRLTQSIRSEQNSILEYTALRSANGVTNEERQNIDSIIEEEKNHMVAMTTMLYKQLLINHKENVDMANDEFILPTFGVDSISDNSKLTESVEKLLSKVESSINGIDDEYLVGDVETGRKYKGLEPTLSAIKSLITTNGDEVVVQNITISDNSKLTEDNFTSVDDFIKELKSDTNYDEIAYHIHEYSKFDKKKALELMDLLFNNENNKNPKECINLIISALIKNEDTKISEKNDKYLVELDVKYDNDVVNQIFDNIARVIDDYNKTNDIKISDLSLHDGKFFFSTNKAVDETFVENFCKDIFDKATNYEYQIIIK